MPTLQEMREAARARSAGDFDGKIRAYYPYWDAQYRPYLLAALNAFPESQLDFKPAPEVLTARQAFLHIADVERGWIHSIVDGNPDEDWVVPAEDPADGWRTLIEPPDRATLFGLLERWHEPTRRWLERPPAEFARVVRHRFPDGIERSYTLHWILDHVQEHEIHHRAQLNLYLRLLGTTPPSI